MTICIGSGVLNFLAIKHQNELLSAEVHAYSPIDELAVFNQSRNIDHTTIGLLWKIAIAYEKDKLSAGLTFTTPKLNLYGTGSTFYQDIYTGPEETEINGNNKIYISNYQEGLSSRHYSPAAIGLGLGYQIVNSRIHLSAEWFAAVKEYELMTSELFSGQSTDAYYQIRMIDKLDQVINFGIGYEYNLSSRYSFFVSFSTDFSAVHKETPQYLENPAIAYGSMIQANIYHVGGGVLLNTKWLEITAGFSHAFARQSINRPFEFPREGLHSASTDKVDMYLSRWKFVLGFSIPFIKKDKILEYD